MKRAQNTFASTTLPFHHSSPAKALLLAVMAVHALLLAGCSRSETALPIGQEVVIRLDRGVLGAAGSLPVAAPMTEEINGAITAIRGTLLAAKDGWMVLKLNNSPGFTYWIPRDKVLLIQVAAEKQDAAKSASTADIKKTPVY